MIFLICHTHFVAMQKFKRYDLYCVNMIMNNRSNLTVIGPSEDRMKKEKD